MRLLLILTAILILSPSAVAQTPGSRVADALGGGYIGGHRIAGKPPNGYDDFLVMWVDDIGICRKGIPVNRKENLLPDLGGRIAVCGRVVFKGWRYPQGVSDSDGKYLSYEFNKAYLIEHKAEPVRLAFDTKAVDGVSYHFEGVYSEHRKDQPGDGRVHLEGKMSKLHKGRKVAETTLRFSPYAIIE